MAPTIQANGFDERVIYKITNLPACGADRQSASRFEDHRRVVEKGLQEAPELSQGLFTATAFSGFLDPRGPRAASGFFEGDVAARQHGVDQDLAGFSALPGQPIRELWIEDLFHGSLRLSSHDTAPLL
ncbi:MAG: hypothetical protein DMF53_13460 [Acidobacteria bacterium]|nr:MAG: hypothetical protein DMF53_13460 [Acidobacteriota bacterium]